MGLKRSLVTIAISGAVGAAALVAPADATPAGGGNYAATVATSTQAIINNHKKTITFGSYTFASSPVVGKLHGSLNYSIKRVKTGQVVYSAKVAINGLSGKGYAVNVSKGLFLPGKKYRFIATYTAKSGHIEKSSTNFKSFYR